MYNLVITDYSKPAEGYCQIWGAFLPGCFKFLCIKTDLKSLGISNIQNPVCYSIHLAWSRFKAQEAEETLAGDRGTRARTWGWIFHRITEKPLLDGSFCSFPTVKIARKGRHGGRKKGRMEGEKKEGALCKVAVTFPLCWRAKWQSVGCTLTSQSLTFRTWSPLPESSLSRFPSSPLPLYLELLL